MSFRWWDQIWYKCKHMNSKSLSTMIASWHICVSVHHGQGLTQCCIEHDSIEQYI